MNEGDELPKYIYKPTPTHLFRWSAAIENFHRIHYDLDFGLNHDRNPSILVHGSWKQSVVPQYLKDWTLPNGWPWKARFEHRAMLVPGDVLIMWGRITSKYEKSQMGFIELEIGMKTQDGIESMPGTATVVLPLRDGPPDPLPLRTARRLTLPVIPAYPSPSFRISLTSILRPLPSVRLPSPSFRRKPESRAFHASKTPGFPLSRE